MWVNKLPKTKYKHGPGKWLNENILPLVKESAREGKNFRRFSLNDLYSEFPVDIIDTILETGGFKVRSHLHGTYEEYIELTWWKD